MRKPGLLLLAMAACANSIVDPTKSSTGSDAGRDSRFERNVVQRGRVL